MKSEKITISHQSTPRRRYEDACAAAHALELVGDRWALLVIRELMTGPKRFGAIRSGLPGISANVLAQRLVELEAFGILSRATLPPPADIAVYELTAWGYASEPIFQALGRWAVRSPFHDPTLAFSNASLVLSLRTMFDPARAEGLALKVGLRLGTERFVAKVGVGSIAIMIDSVAGADVVFTGEAPSIAAAVYGGRPLQALEADGALTVEGDRGLAERFLTLFPLPDR